MPAKITNEIVDARLKDRTVKRIGEYVNNKIKIIFACIECGHEWNSRPNGILNGHGCPLCGVKGLTNEIVDARLEGRTVKRVGDYISAITKITFGCTVCGYEWKSTPHIILNSGCGCPDCAGCARLTTEIVDARLDGHTVKRVGDFVNMRTKCLFACTDCGYEWETVPPTVLDGKGCPDCAGHLPLTNEIVDARLDGHTVKRVGDFVSMRTKCLFACTDCGYEWETAPPTVLDGTGCPDCAGTLPLTNQIVDARLKDRTVKRLGDYVNNKIKTTFACIECGYEWESPPNDILRGTGCPCCTIAGFNYAEAARFYIIQIGDLYKVGITGNSIENRYKSEGVKYKIILDMEFPTGFEAAEFEKMVMAENAEHQYTGPQIFSHTGTTEMFTHINW